MPLARSEEHSLPAVHALHLADLVQQWNVVPADLFADLDVREESLGDPAARLPVATIVALVERARTLTKEPVLGWYIGQHMRVSAYGFLGFAAMSASTVGEALDLATRFAPTITGALDLRLDVEGMTAALTIGERADLGPARDAVVLALVVGIWQIGRVLAGRPIAGRVEFAFPMPPYAPRLAVLAPDVSPHTRFGAAANRMVFDAEVLGWPLVMADPAATRLAREQCERELASIQGDAQLLTRVRALLPQQAGRAAKGAAAHGFRSLEEVATEMHLSARTLKRRLASHGIAFTTLLAEAQRERALQLLRSTELSIDEVAERVGYSDVANFTRAFRRWTGVTPAAYRNASSGR
jgi:AraC-like DNA-binding protein